jgi:hypothetical protein
MLPPSDFGLHGTWRDTFDFFLQVDSLSKTDGRTGRLNRRTNSAHNYNLALLGQDSAARTFRTNGKRSSILLEGARITTAMICNPSQSLLMNQVLIHRNKCLKMRTATVSSPDQSQQPETKTFLCCLLNENEILFFVHVLRLVSATQPRSGRIPSVTSL